MANEIGSVIFRKATEADLDECTEMGVRFWKTELHYGEPDWEHINKLLSDSMRQGLLCVADADFGLVGMCGALSFPSLGSPDVMMASEFAWWVEPEYRKYGFGSILLETIEDLAREAGIDYLTMAVLSTSPSVEHLYTSRGYSLSEISYTRKL